jgi:hypothetical protein
MADLDRSEKSASLPFMSVGAAIPKRMMLQFPVVARNDCRKCSNTWSIRPIRYKLNELPEGLPAESTQAERTTLLASFS